MLCGRASRGRTTARASSTAASRSPRPRTRAPRPRRTWVGGWHAKDVARGRTPGSCCTMWAAPQLLVVTAATPSAGWPCSASPPCPAGQQLMFHVLGTPQSQDVTVLADPDHPTWMFGTEVGRSLRSCRRVASHAAVGGWVLHQCCVCSWVVSWQSLHPCRSGKPASPCPLPPRRSPRMGATCSSACRMAACLPTSSGAVWAGAWGARCMLQG